MWCLRVAKYVSGASKLHRSVQTKHCCKWKAQGEFQPLSILPLSGIILLLPGLSWRKARSHVLDPASQLHRCLSFLWVHILPSWNSTDLCGFLVCLLSRTISPLSSSVLFSCISLLFLSLKIAHNPLKFLPIRLFFFSNDPSGKACFPSWNSLVKHCHSLLHHQIKAFKSPTTNRFVVICLGTTSLDPHWAWNIIEHVQSHAPYRLIEDHSSFGCVNDWQSLSRAGCEGIARETKE